MTGRMILDPAKSARWHLIVGGIVAFAFAGGAGGYAATTELAGAAIAQAQVVVDSDVKKVQHPTGGVVGRLYVRDGDRVHAGDILVKLDETQTRANLEAIQSDLDELAARQAREDAEQEGANLITFPADLLARAGDPQVAALLAGERKLFEVRLADRTAQKAQLEEQIRGIAVQQKAREDQIAWIDKELVGVRGLFERKLEPFERLTTLERERARLEGERGQLISSAAETMVKILLIDRDMRAEDGKDLADVRGKKDELLQKRIAAEDQLKRIDIRAPQTGIIDQLSVHTIGGVISPGEQIMLVVPDGDALVVEAKVRPQDIDQVQVGEQAGLRFTGFNQRSTPELYGLVKVVSADVSEDKRTGASYYVVRISVPQSEIKRLGGLQLVPGMPVETFIHTGQRTVASYLMRPLHDQIARAFRDK